MHTPHPIQRRERRRTTLVMALALALALLMPATMSAAGVEPVAIPTLDWQPCADTSQAGFECATAIVPLDYAAPERAAIELAVVRRPADDPASRIGTLFFNPGGPGGPGTQDLPAFFPNVPAALRARFDLVSWDPRGIGDSTAVQCFDTAEQAQRFFADIPSTSYPDTADERRAWADAYVSFGQQCAQRNGDLLAHVSTADTARDLDLLRAAVGEERLSYLGLSYGTLLGATYANLFPDRVRALVLDGNVDPAAWTNNIDDTAILGTGLRLGSDLANARTLAAFLELCGRATVAQCGFSAGSPDATAVKWATLLYRLRMQPVTIDGLVIDDTLAVTAMAGYLTTVPQQPGFRGWAGGAAVLQAMWSASEQGAATPAPGAAVTPTGIAQDGKTTRYAGPEQASAVQCGESPNPRPGEAFSLLAEIGIATRAGAIGNTNFWADSPCASWPVVAANPYAGPWNRPTVNPILVIGNTYDPSTPYEGAVSMAALLADARLLTVDGYGHTVLLNPSSCASEHMSRYFVDGALPPAGTVCAQDQQPFAPAAQQ